MIWVSFCYQADDNDDNDDGYDKNDYDGDNDDGGLYMFDLKLIMAF